MFKKYMCLVLSVLMVLCTISTTALAAQPSVDGLSASYISFTSGGAAFTEIPASAASVTANVNVSNASANASPVILWVGKYVDDVLTDVKYVRQTIAAGASNTPVSVTIDGVKKETETVTVNGTSTEREKSVILKAFVWTSFTGGKSLAPSASVPSDDSTFLFVTKNGQPWTEFNQNTYSYDIALDRATIEAVPTFSFAAKDNATKIEEPDAYAIGVNQVKVTTAKGTEKTYSIKIAYSRPNISVALTDDASKAGGVSQPKIIDESFGSKIQGLFTDRMNYKAVVVGSELVGGTLITFGTRQDKQPGNQPFHQTGKMLANFSADAGGTMYVVMRARSTVYENAGWTAVANGATPKNPDTGAEYTDNEMKALFKNDELRIATDAPYAISWGQVGTDAAKQSVLNHPTRWVWCYAKTFAAGETLVIPTQGYGGDVIVPIVKFDDPKPIVQDDATLAALKYSVDSASHDISGFAPSSAGSVYNVTLPAGTASVGVSAIASQGAASTVAITADTSIDANNVVTLVDRKTTVTVEVTAPDGVTKETYAVNFTAEKFIWEMQNKIYDVDVSNQTFYVPSKTTPETASVATMKLYGSPATDKFYITRGTEAGWAAVAVEDDLVRDVTLIAGDTGKLYTSSNTSAMFEGATSFKVSANAMRNKYNKFDESGNQIGAAAPTNGGSKFQPYFEGALSGTNGEPYWLSFKVTSPCTVYVSTVQGTSDWYNHPADWTKNTDSSLKLAGGNFYYKEYAAGETVNIPNYGTSDEIAGDRIFWEPNGVAIIWSTTPPSTNAALSGIKVNGVDVAGVSSSDASGKRYSATAAHDAVEAVVEATAADDGATITYSPADGKAASIPGTVEINVMAEDGETTATYYVDITRALPPSDNAKLSSLTYSVNGKAAVAVGGFAATDEGGTYNVELPANALTVTLSGTVSDLSATIDSTNATVDLTAGTSAKLVVVSGDSTVTREFVVNFTLAAAYQGIEAVPRTIYYTATADGSKSKIQDYEPMTGNGTRTDYVVKLPADITTTTLGIQKRMTREGTEGAFTEEAQTVEIYPSATANVGDTVKIAVTSADKTKTNTYTVKIEQYAPAVRNGLNITINPEHPYGESQKYIKINPSAVDVGIGFYPDRNPQHAWANVGSAFKGATQIWAPIADSTRTNNNDLKNFLNSNKEYYHFTAEKPGRVYVMAPSTTFIGEVGNKNYSTANGWTKISLVKPAAGATYDWNTVFDSTGEYSAARWQYGSAVDSVVYPFTMNKFYKLDGTELVPGINIIDAAAYKDFAAGETVSIPVIGVAANENVQAVIVWKESSSNTKLSKLTYNVGGGNADSMVDGFTADDVEGTYNVTLPAGVNEIDFAAEAADSAATVAFSANVVGGKIDVSSGSAVVTVEVTAENGDKKTFTVNFTKQTLIGEITTNGGLTVTKAATPLVFNSGLFVDRMNWVTPVIGEKLIGLDYFPIYSNKSPAAKALSETNGIYFSFVTEVPVTMYVASRDIMATTFETRGWKLIASTGLKNPATGNDYTVDELTALYDAGTGEISTASPYALVYGQRDEMTGSGTYGKLNWPGILSNTYAKTFAAGETVEIPTSGTTAEAPYVPVAKYHIPKVSTADDTALDIVLAGSTEMAFDGTDKYRITLSSDITSVKLSAVASAIGASVAISNENLTFGTGSRTANETITVTAPDGVTTKVYNVEIKVELPLSEQSDKVYDLRTATGQSIYPENNGYYDGDYVAGSSTGNRVAIVESITDDTLISANRSAKYSTLGTLVGATGILTFGSNALGGSYDDYTDGVKGIWYKDNGDGTYSRLGANSTAEGATKIDRTSYFRPFYNESVYNTSSFKLDDEYTWYEFKISSPATVYVGQDFEGTWALGESNGWSNVTGGKVKMWGNTLYSKHYNAGETVKIPIRGGFTDVTRTMWETFAVAVMWDDKVVKSSDAKLSSLTYQIGSEAAVAVNGFNAADEGGTYSVDLPAGTTSVTVAATAADAGASAPVYSSEGGVVDVTSGSGTITVTTLAEDGTTTHTYTINFTVAVESNYNLKSLTYNGISIPKFTQDYYTYVIYMPTAAPVAIVGTPVDSSKAVVVSDDTVPTTAGKEVTVTVGEGADSKTYTLTIYLDERADRVLNVSGPFADDSTVAVVADGESSADFKGATKVFAYTTDASKAAFFSDKYDGSDVNSYWTEFIVSSGATVYYVDTIGAFDPTTSWIINPNGFVKVGTANAYTIKLNESVTASAANGNFYMKKVEAGGVIQLPAYGSTGAPSDTASIETLPFCIVVWDSSIVTPPVEEGGIEDGGE